MDLESIKFAAAEGVSLSKQAETKEIAKYLIEKYTPEEELKKFSSTEIFENYLNRYLNHLKVLIRRCAEYGEKTSLYDVFTRLADNLEKKEENLPRGHDIFNDFQKEIIRLVMSIDNADVILFILEIMNNFSMFWGNDVIDRILSNVLAKIPVDRANVLLKCKKIYFYPCLNSFLCRVLISHESKEIRDQCLKILKRPRVMDNETQCIITLEELCRIQPLDIAACLDHVKKNKLCTFSCFERMAESFGARETRGMVETVIELNRQRIPKYFVEKFKEYTAENNPGILGIAESLIKGKYCDVSDIKCMRKLLKSKETCQEAIDLINTAIDFANDIPASIRNEIEKAATNNENANKLFTRCRKIFGMEKADDILANPREKLAKRREALKEIVSNKQFHTNRIVKLLVTRIQYDEDLRNECFEALVMILPKDYSTKGFSLNLKIIITSISRIVVFTEDLSNAISSLLRKDSTVDLSDTLIALIYEGENHTLKIVSLFLDYFQLFESVKGKLVIVSHSNDLLKKIRSIDDWNARDNICKKLMDVCKSNSYFCKLSEPVRSLITTCTPFLAELTDQSPKRIDEDFLEAIKMYIGQGYPIPESLITFLIKSLQVENFKDYFQRIGKILFLLNSDQNLGHRAKEIFHTMLDNILLFESNVTDSLISIIKEWNIKPEDSRSYLVVYSRFVWKLHDNLNCPLKKQNLMKVVNLVFKDFEFHFDVREKLADILSNDAEAEQNRILAARILMQQITLAKLPTSINQSLENVVKNPRGNVSWELYDCVFQALEGNIGTDNLSTDVIETYYKTLKDRLVGSDTSKCENLKSLDEYFKAESYTKENKLRLLKILSYVVSKNLNLNVDNIFVKFKQNEWQEMLLRSVLIASILKRFTRTDGNEFLVQRLWQNVNSLKKYLIVASQNQGVIAQNRFENILQGIIYKQDIHSFELNAINDILTALCCSELVFETISQPNCLLSDIRQKWMEVNLVNHGIAIHHDYQLMKMCSYFKYGMVTLEMVFSKLKSNGNICELLYFFEIMDSHLSTEEENNHFLANDILKNASIADWILQLQKVLIRKMIADEFPDIPASNINRNKTGSEDMGSSLHVRNSLTRRDILEELFVKLTKLRELGWLMHSIKTLIKLQKETPGSTTLLQALDMIIVFRLREYDANGEGDNLLHIFTEVPRKWIKRIQKVINLRIFSGTYIKPIDTLIREIRARNTHLNKPLLEHEKLLEVWNKIVSFNNSQLFQSKRICDWSKEELKLWAQKFKSLKTAEQKESLSLYEKMAVTKRAVEVTTDSKVVPRTVQLLSLYFMLTTEENKGRLMQINTGEGKTTIIAMFAAIRALEGHHVDIITSSPELAIPQSKEQTMFFESFGLTVSHVEEGRNDLCYKAGVIYGSANTFMGDVLRDEYHKLNVRCGRKFDIAVVDEVDSMLIDGKDHIVMLSSPMPALNHLEPVLAEIWVQMLRVANSIHERNGALYYSQLIYAKNENGKIEVVGHNDIELKGTKEQCVKKSTELHLRKMLRDLKEGETVQEDYPKLEIPKHLRPLTTEVQLSNWIDSAIRACYRCESGKDYIIRNNRIVPVDALNTGIVQLNMLWSNGLHQFLQFKHGANVTPENLTTNFISNVTFFKRYGCQLYGLTGTLESILAQELLDETYNVDSLIIPPFQKRQYLEIDPIISRSKEAWYQSVVQSSLIHLENGRAVLIITKYIDDADHISNMFRDINFNKNKIKMYRTAGDSDAIKGELKASEVIVATNIAGRGTDIKPSKEVESNGGLHVCVTFLPINQRVEQQNVGRTSRTGHRGTAQFVLLEQTKSNIIALKKNRNKEEKASLEKAKDDMAKVLMKDDIFHMFCDLLHKVAPYSSDSISRRAVEERFAIWLKMNEENMTCETKKCIVERFNVFKKEIENDAEKNSLPKNPYYHIIRGNDLLANQRYEYAIEEFDNAIEMDKDFVADAYYYRAYAYIAKYGNKVKKNHCQIKKAIDDLEKAKSIIKNTLEPMISILSQASKAEVFSKQIRRKLDLLTVQKTSILAATGCEVDNIINHSEARKNEIPPEGATAKNKIIKEDKKNIKQRSKGAIRDMMNAGINIVPKIQDNEAFITDKNGNDYEEEIAENNYNGQVGYFQVTERKPLYRTFALFIFGMSKIVAGLCLIAFTPLTVVGACLVFALMSTGLAQIFTAIKDGFFARNKHQAWENCGVLQFALLEVSIGFYGWKAIMDTVMSLVKGENKLPLVENVVSEKDILENSEKLGEALGQELVPEISQGLDCISKANTDIVLLPDTHQRIFDGIKAPFQQILAKYNKVLKILQSDGNSDFKEYIYNKIDNLVFENDKNGIRETVTSYLSKPSQMPIDKINKAVTEVCNTFSKSFDNCLENITFVLSAYEHKKVKSMQIAQSIASANVVFAGDIDINKGKIALEQVKFEDELKTLSDDMSFKLSGKIADHIHQKISGVQTSNTDAIDEMTKKFEEFRKREQPHAKKQQQRQLEVESRLVADVVNFETLIENMRNELIGVVHLDPMSAIINRPIVVFNEGNRLVRIIGSSHPGEYVNIQYRRNGLFEYWTLPGNSEPKYRLLDLIAEQISENREQLRDRIIEKMNSGETITRISEQLRNDQSRDLCYKDVLMA